MIICLAIILNLFSPHNIIKDTTMNQSQEMKWWQQTNVYQIYPRSYMDSDGDGIGDLNGIISKLDYIKSIGFETIWISPFYNSPQQDFGYDISDYMSIAPEYGTLETAEKLISEVHKRGMKIVFDMVMNHTSVEHAWFKESRSSTNNPRRNWYIWQKGKGSKRPPNNWKCMIGGSGWQYDKTTDEWYWASFLPFQPDLNYHNPEVKKAMFDVVRFWLGKGVDGFRLDIFNAIYKDSSFRNNPFSFRPLPSESNSDGFFQKLKYNINNPMNYTFAKELRQVIDEFQEPERFLVGEVFGKDDSIKQYLGKNLDGLNLIFLFETLKFKFKAHFFKNLITNFENHYPYPYTPTYVYSNHDRLRSIYKLGNNHEKAKIIVMFQMMARGVPVTYMGEEIGMEELFIPFKHGLDPLAQKYKWVPLFLVKIAKMTLNRDGCRTPMQWDSNQNAGFSSTQAKTWLPVNDNYKRVNVGNQINDSNSLLNTYKELLIIRKQFDAVRKGSIEMLKLPCNDVLVFKRIYNGETLLIALNFGNKTRNIKLEKEYEKIYSTGSLKINDKNIALDGISGVILKEN